MKTWISTAAAAAMLCGAMMVVGHAQSKAHVLQNVKDTQWGPAPPMLPPGAQVSVLSGDPGKAAPFSLRAKMPANYRIPAHSHPTDENVVVISGALTFGMGDTLVKGAASNTRVAAGGYALMPGNMNHFAYTTGETTILLYAIGPLDFKYVNAADDPRNAKK